MIADWIACNEILYGLGKSVVFRSMSGRSGKQRKQKKDNKGMTSQHEPKTNPSNVNNSQILIDINLNNPINNTSDILSKSTAILYGPRDNHFSFCGQSGGVVYSSIPAQGGNTQLNSAQMASMNYNQGPQPAGIQHSQPK